MLVVNMRAIGQNSNKVIEALKLESNAQNIRLSSTNNCIFKLPNALSNQKETQEILRNNNLTYVTLNGTSKVFINTIGDSLDRIDETKYDGYSFGAVNVIYHDTLYSFGGYGFWQMNGGVRYFDARTKEWNVVKTKRLVNIASGINCISYYDKQKEKLYLIYQPGSTEYLKESESDSRLLVDIYDFKVKNWIKSPLEFNNSVANKFKDLDCLLKIQDGIVVNSSKLGNAYFLNLNENKIYAFNENKVTEYIQLRNRHPNNVIYSAGNTLKIYDRDLDSVFSIPYNQKQFEKTSLAIYNPYFSFMDTNYIINILLILYGLLISTIAFIQFRKNRILNSANYIRKEVVNEFSEFINILEIMEKIVLKTVYENSSNNLHTNTHQLNKILGSEKKDLKIQNNIRSEIILSINKKFKAYTNNSNDLIERERAETDKRYMEYTINNLFINKFTNKNFR